MPENAAAEGGFGKDAPDRSDNNRGGAREDREARAEKAKSFERALDNANRPDRAPAAPPSIGAPPSSSSPADTDKKADNDDEPDDRGFLDRVTDMLTAPPTDVGGNLRSTSPVADRINNTVNYSLKDVVGPPADPARDAAIAMANAEFGVGMQVMRQDMNRAIDKSVANYDQKIADVDQRLAEIDERLSPKSQNGVAGLGMVGSASAEEARNLMAEGRALRSEREALEGKRTGLENARNLPDTLDMAHIARDVYEVDSKLANSHISRLNDQELKEAGLEPSLLENPDIGFHAEVYRNDITGEAVLAFEGTDPNSFPDLLANGAQGVGLTSAQYKAANEAARNFDIAFAGENRSVTGHSLGGGLASYAALGTDMEATTFNTSGLHAQTLERLGVTREQGLDLITAHHVKGEALNTTQDSLLADLGATGAVTFAASPVLGSAAPLAGAAYLGYSDFDPVPEAIGQRQGYEAVNSRGKLPGFEGGLVSDLDERVDLHSMDAMLNTLRHERQRIEDEIR